MIEIYAGKTAIKTIQQEGFNQALFSHFLGASGGPKWFCLYSLDKYLFGEFFKDRKNELNLLGSSAGAFRAACFAQKNPIGAIERLAKSYAETTYSEKAKPDEITQKARQLLDVVFDVNGAQQIIENPVFKAHFIVAKANGLVASDNKYLQGMGLVNSYVRNKLSRKFLSKQYARFVFQSPTSELSFSDPDNIQTHMINLNKHNIKEALLASGSIPMVMQGIKNIPGSANGMYRDGGIIDYHFDLKLEGKGLTLYPHFNANPKAGWFDKNSKRCVRPEHYNQTVLICPSPEFINSLPYQKIPDRNDFVKMDSNTRIKYWKTVFDETQRMADTFNDFVVNQTLDMVKPMPFDR